ncbi:MAG: hypothetical protein V4551_08570 [Pseudomonadota bacterium]
MLRAAPNASPISHPALACGTALRLSIDVSGSIDGGDCRLRTEGLAFSDPAVAEAMWRGQVAMPVGLSRMFRVDLQQLEVGTAVYRAPCRRARDGHEEEHDRPAGRPG